jgi:hypothetical protein
MDVSTDNLVPGGLGRAGLPQSQSDITLTGTVGMIKLVKTISRSALTIYGQPQNTPTYRQARDVLPTQVASEVQRPADGIAIQQLSITR